MGDVHNRKKNLQNTLNKIRENPELSEENTKLLIEFKDHLLAENISVERTCRYMSSWNTLAPLFDFSLENADKKDLKKLVGKINQDQINGKDYSVWTLAEFKKAVRKLYTYLEGEEEPELVDFVSVNVKETDKPRTDPSELPRPSDVKSMLKHASNNRDRALIFFTWDTGGRISEILNVKWKDIEFGENLTKVRFRESKTGERKVHIRESVETIKQWKQESPNTEPDDYVFITLKGYGETEKGDQMPYSTASQIFKRLGDGAELECKYNPHAFRKGRATNMAGQGMNQAQLCEYFGWVQGSDQAATYIRMAEQDLEKAVKQIHGLEETEEEKEDLSPKTCASCDSVNPGYRDQCKECGNAITEDVDKVIEMKEEEVTNEVKTDIVEELFDKMGMDQDEREQFMDRKMEEKVSEMEFFQQ
ncbi:MAG: tyrosine-type recombinase/integrase [Candidatus Nanohaloarchaea archaeon]